MRDAITKLGILFRVFMYDAFVEWHSEVWRRDLDELQCCAGGNWDSCGCGGLTVREMFDRQPRGGK